MIICEVVYLHQIKCAQKLQFLVVVAQIRFRMLFVYLFVCWQSILMLVVLYCLHLSLVNAGEDDTPASTGVYIGRETIQRQVQNAQNMLYAVPVSSNTAAVNVSNLSELSQSGQLQLGSRLGSHASSVAITGALDFCSFLNGT